MTKHRDSHDADQSHTGNNQGVFHDASLLRLRISFLIFFSSRKRVNLTTKQHGCHCLPHFCVWLPTLGKLAKYVRLSSLKVNRTKSNDELGHHVLMVVTYLEDSVCATWRKDVRTLAYGLHHALNGAFFRRAGDAGGWI